MVQLQSILESTAVEWMTKTGLVKYHYPPNQNIGTQQDRLSLGLITPKSDAVMLRVDSASSNHFLELQIVSTLIFFSLFSGKPNH